MADLLQIVQHGFDHDPIVTTWQRIRWVPYSAPEAGVQELGDA
ncbi:hypothetical protein ACPXB3_22295 [Gordonia sp. DT219]